MVRNSDPSRRLCLLALKACAHLLDVRHGISLADVVGDWFWDGHVGAMNVLMEFLPQAKGHLCVEHTKRNIEKRYQGGHKPIMKKTIEMLSFTTPMGFHVAAELVIEGLLEENQDTSYLAAVRQGCAFVAQGDLWTAPWRSCGMHSRLFNVCATSC